jgi:hypothetical protein
MTLKIFPINGFLSSKFTENPGIKEMQKHILRK